MPEHIRKLLLRYRKTGVIVDSNLLLIYFLGLLDKSLIGRTKHTDSYCPKDFNVLANLIKFVGKVVSLPNILTEVSNLSGHFPDAWKRQYFERFAKDLTVLDECYLASPTIAESPEFSRFGLTDAGIYLTARGKYLVVTDDFPLSNFLQKNGVDAINFTHIRPKN